MPPVSATASHSQKHCVILAQEPPSVPRVADLNMQEEASMDIAHLPRNTWVVFECVQPNDVALVSAHAFQTDAEAERDQRNRAAHCTRFSACMILDPVAERMGAPASPTPFLNGLARRSRG